MDVLRAALDWLVVGADALSGGFRAEQFANGLSLLAVGGPVWALHWREVQRVAHLEGRDGQVERSSGPRRAYLYGVALVGALLILFDLATLLYRLLLWIMGEPNADLFGAETLDSLIRSGTAALLWIVHVMAIRRDTQVPEIQEAMTPAEMAERRAALKDRIRHLEGELATARSLLEDLPDPAAQEGRGGVK